MVLTASSSWPIRFFKELLQLFPGTWLCPVETAFEWYIIGVYDHQRLFCSQRTGPDSERWMNSPAEFLGLAAVSSYSNAHVPRYDWVVVYEDLPSLESDRHPTSSSTFDCDQKNTVLVTTEPASIKVYGKKYLDQFGLWCSLHRSRPTFRARKLFTHNADCSGMSGSTPSR